MDGKRVWGGWYISIGVIREGGGWAEPIEKFEESPGLEIRVGDVESRIRIQENTTRRTTRLRVNRELYLDI